MLFKKPRAFVLAAFVVASPACLVDSDNRCGENQKYDEPNARCICASGYSLDSGRCVACGLNEVTLGGSCECAEGFTRKAPDAACEENAALGQSCEADEECTSPEYPYCRRDDRANPGYCTSTDCDSGSSCLANYACNTREVTSFCEHPPEGIGTGCADDKDCSGFTASYCEAIVSKTCVVNDCAPDPNKCHGDWVCCDIGLLGQSLCIPPSELDAGKCPAGGTLVPRGK